jgi:hypothetical protein
MCSKRYAVLTLVVTLLLAGTAHGCGPGPIPTLTRSELDEIGAACKAETALGIEALNENPDFRDLVFVPDQVIVTGAPDMVAQVAEAVQLRDLIGSYELDQQTVMHLYNSTGRPVQEVVCEVNALEPRFGAFADPNYYASPAQWIGAGSPWTQNGEWIGSLDGGGLSSAAGGDAFWGQWALGPQGMHLFQTDGTRWGQQTGAGTRIAIFDTSPFDGADWEDRRCKDCSLPDLMHGAEVFSSLAMTLTVWYPFDLTEAPTCPGDREPVKESSSKEGAELGSATDHVLAGEKQVVANRNGEDQNISSHGLFVAGLAYAVAPDSDLYLIRVLEKDGCGTLYDIVKGIDVFMDESRATEQDMHSTVFNLSFGMHKPPPEYDFALPGDIRFGTSDIRTLKQALQQADDEGVTIVAAAGNDSYKPPPDPVREMELPAGYDFVTGVAASSIDRGRGCFSNKGDIAAPGGNGAASGTDPCVIPACSDSDPGPCLVSLVYEPPARYAYWVGTSFAAPLVSGQRALLLGMPAWPPGSDVCPEATPTSLQGGIINWAKVSGAPCP